MVCDCAQGEIDFSFPSEREWERVKKMLLSIDMVPSFTLEGVLTPVKYRLATEDEINEAIPVERVTDRREEKTKESRMLSFRCSSTVDGVEQN